ncbi:MAG: segregation/condensation protein A [Clostridia bacterium]|nr:segregation/condensation protein A [Clostridia bacterium]
MTADEMGREGEEASRLLEEIALVEARLEKGERVPVGPIARAARDAFGRPEADLEAASLALVRVARALERAARLDLPEAPPADGEAGPEGGDGDEDGEGPSPDAWAERLQELEAFQEVVQALRAFEREARRRFPRGQGPTRPPVGASLPELLPDELVRAFEGVWRRAAGRRATVARDPVTVPERMAEILRLLDGRPAAFERLFRDDASRREVIVTFLALLELVRAGRVAVVQERPLGPITVVPRSRPDVR